VNDAIQRQCTMAKMPTRCTIVQLQKDAFDAAARAVVDVFQNRLTFEYVQVAIRDSHRGFILVDATKNEDLIAIYKNVMLLFAKFNKEAI